MDKIGLQAVFEDQQFVAGINRYNQAVMQADKTTAQAAGDMSKSAAGVGKAWDASAVAVTAATAAIAAGLAKLVKEVTMTAARTQELGIVLNRVGQNIGKNAEEMAQYEAGVKAMGITTQAARQALIQMVQAQIDLSHSTELARLAQDAAVIAQLNSSEAYERLITTIQRGSPLMARTLGLVVDFEGAYERWAEANDRTVDSLTAAEKIEIRTQNVLENSAQIAGTYEAAMGTAGKQVRSMSRYTEELANKMGESLLPAFGEGVGLATDLLKQLNALPAPVIQTTTQVLALAAGIGAVSGAARVALPLLQAMNVALGPVGIAAAAIAAAAGLVLYAQNLDRAHQAESAAIVDATTNYENYILQLRGAELGSYALSESLYEMVKAAQAAGDALTAAQLVEQMRDLQSQLMSTTGIDWLDEFVNGVRGAQFNTELWGRLLDQVLPKLSDLQLRILEDEETLEAWAAQMGLSAEETNLLIQATQEAVDAQQLLNLAHEAATVAIGDHEDRMLGLTKAQFESTRAWATSIEAMAAAEAEVRQLTSGFEEMAIAALAADPAVAAVAAQLEKLIDKGGEADAIAYTFEQLAAIARGAEEELREIADQANEDIEKAEAKHLDQMEDLAQDHAAARAKIQSQIGDVHADLLRDMADAEREFQEKRLDLEQQYAQEIADAERELAQDRADAQEDYLRDLADIERDYARDVADLHEELARDLADIDDDYRRSQIEAEQEYYRSLEELAEEHGQRVADIEEKYAQKREAIEDKYRTEPTRDEEIDARRKQLLKELEEIRKHGEKVKGATTYREEEIQRELDQLKQEELDALKEAQQKELDELAQWLADEQAKRDEAYQQQLDEDRRAYEERRAERQRQAEEDLADLEKKLAREREDRERAYQEQLADLEKAHARQLEELDRANQERLKALDDWLADEQDRLTKAAKQRLDSLDDQLKAEGKNFQDRKQQLDDALDDEKQSIADKMQEQAETAETKAKEAADAIITAWEGINDPVANALRNVLDSTIMPWVDGVLEEIRRMKSGIEQELESSPVSGWFRKEGQAIGRGLEMGLGDLGDILTPQLEAIQAFVVDVDRAVGQMGKGRKVSRRQIEQLSGVPEMPGTTALWAQRRGEGAEAPAPPQPSTPSDIGSVSRAFFGPEAGMPQMPTFTAALELEPILPDLSALATDLNIGAKQVSSAPITNTSTSSSLTHNHNLSVTANYEKPQPERSLREDLARWDAMMRARAY